MKKINYIGIAAIVPILLTVFYTLKVISGVNEYALHALFAGCTSLFLLWIGDVAIIPEDDMRDMLVNAEREKQRLKFAIMWAIKDLEEGKRTSKIIDRLRNAVWRDE